MKKKTLLTAILSIVMCLSLMAGATFALFTSESKVNIAITSGKVELTATVSDVYLKDLNETTYTRTVADGETVGFESQDGFTDTRTLKFDGQKLYLSNISCGDAVKFNVNVENTSTIAAKYRVIISTENNTGLFEGLVVGVGGKTFRGLTYTPWKLLTANTDGETIGFEIELPDTGNNAYDNKFKGKACDIVVTVEGIQGNAETFDDLFVQEDVEVSSGITEESVVLGTSNDIASALVPQGVKLENGANTLTLSVTEEVASTKGFILSDETQQFGYNISIPEVADDNTTPILVTINATEGLENVALLHKNAPMTKVGSVGEVAADNEFYYDKTTGVITLATVGFSNFTLLSDITEFVVADSDALISALNADYDVKLGTDIVFDNGVGTNGLSCTGDASFTIDLNGYTVSSDLGGNALRFKIGDGNDVVNKNVEITIKNGTVISGSNNWCAISAATADNSGNKLVLNLQDLNVEANKAGDYAIKSWTGATIKANNVNVISSYAGCFYAVGGELELNNCTATQTGLHTAPYLSMAVGVSNNGKATINSGVYTTTPATKEDANNQGSSHGSWCVGVMNSGGTLIINDGNFANGNYGDDSLATNARGLIFGDTASVVEINGGTFNALKNIIDYQNNSGVQPNPNFIISGGVFNANPTVVTSYGDVEIAEGLVVFDNGDGTYTVRKDATGKVAYRAYVLNDYRQAIQIDMEGIYAEKSLVVELWHGETLLTTTVYAGSYPFNAPGYTTCCVAIKGGFASWTTTIADGVILSDQNVPDKIMVYADGKLTNEFTHNSGTVLADKVNDYLALSGVQKTAE